MNKNVYLYWMEKKDFRSVTDQERGIIRRDAIRMIKRGNSLVLWSSCKYSKRLVEAL